MASGAAWMVGFRLSAQIIGFVSTLILARLLVPEHFGLIAMANALTAMIEMIGAFGLHVTLIQRQDIDRDHFDSAWTLRLIVGVVSASVMALIAPVAAEFFDEAGLEMVIYALSTTFILDACSNIGVVQFQKDLQFNKEFVFMLVPKLIAFLLTIALALQFRSYWALVAGTVVSRLSTLGLSYVMHPFRPRLSLAKAADFYHMSKWLIINNFLSFIAFEAPTLLLGRISTTVAVGFFSVSHEISSIPTTHLIAPINRAVFPGYAKLSQDRESFATAFLDVIQLIAIIVLPIGVGISAVAHLAVPILLGDKWLTAIPLVQIMAVAGAVGALLTNAGSAYLSLGKPHVITVYVGAKVTVMVSLILMLAPDYGAAGTAAAMLIAESLMLPVGIAVAHNIIGITYLAYIKSVIRPIIACLLMATAVYQASESVADSQSGPMTELLVCIATGATVYTSTLLALWALAGRPAGPESTAISKFRKLVTQMLPQQR